MFLRSFCYIKKKKKKEVYNYNKITSHNKYSQKKFKI